MRRRIWLPVAALLAGTVMLNGCPGGGAPAPGGGAGPAVDVNMTDFAFQMSTQTIERGKVLFRVRNTGPSVHNFTINGVKGAASRDLTAGASQDVNVSLDQPGAYTVVCTVPGHKEAGMVTELVVR